MSPDKYGSASKVHDQLLKYFEEKPEYAGVAKGL
jgi:hypothetical protein